MTTFSSEAVLIREDGTEIPVTVNLSSYRNGLRTDWGGTVTPAPDGLRETLNLARARLRLPGGTEAEFLRPDTSDWVGTNRLSISGQGEAPF